MLRFSVNELTTFRWKFEEDVANYAEAGVTAIGVWRPKLADYGEERGIELLAENNMAVSNLLWAAGFTGSEGRSFRECIDDAIEAVELAGALRAECLIVYSGGRGYHTYNHARRLIVSALRELSCRADDHDVTLAIEPMHPECAGESTFLTNLQEALDVIDEVAHPRVGLAMDTYHLGFDEDILPMIPHIADRVAIVHLGDGRYQPQCEPNRCPLGHGILPIRDMIVALNQAGYAGYFDLVLMGEDVEGIDYQELIRSGQAYCDDVAHAEQR